MRVIFASNVPYDSRAWGRLAAGVQQAFACAIRKHVHWNMFRWLLVPIWYSDTKHRTLICLIINKNIAVSYRKRLFDGSRESQLLRKSLLRDARHPLSLALESECKDEKKERFVCIVLNNWPAANETNVRKTLYRKEASREAYNRTQWRESVSLVRVSSWWLWGSYVHHARPGNHASLALNSRNSFLSGSIVTRAFSRLGMNTRYNFTHAPTHIQTH